MKENKGVQGAKPLDDFTSHTDPPSQTDANRLIFCEETAADLFSCNTQSSFFQDTFLFKFSIPNKGVFEWLVIL